MTKEQLSEALHRSYLWSAIPETEIALSRPSEFLVSQEQVEGSWPIDLLTEIVKQDVQDLLDAGSKMQRENNVLFDIFGLQWMINLFNYYFSWTNIKKMSDLLLPANAEYLRMMHNMPPELLLQMNSDSVSPPFIAYNILRDKDWALRFIDTDYRPLDIRHPLNIVWNWITRKALNDLEHTRIVRI